MTAELPTLRSVADLRARVAAWHRGGETVALVPTMGALHAGHLSLVREAKARAARVYVSLFVNPKQFGPNEDFDRYPRDEAADAALLAAEGADLLFAPTVDEIYPEGHLTKVVMPDLGDMLEGRYRPGFFDGVCTVVCKLLLQGLPDVAVFGEKDYQQLLVIRRMVADLNIPTTVVGAPIVREADGLALSSRNAYLSPEQRAVAPALNAALREVAAAVAGGADVAEQTARAGERLLAAGFDKVDYLEVRDAATLAPVAEAAAPAQMLPARMLPARVLAAAFLGNTRLIDNVAVEAAG